MRHKYSVHAFSLVEVIIATGLFAASVTVIIALLPGLARQGGESVDLLAARRSPCALKVELLRLGASGFDALAAQAPTMSAPLTGGLAFVADQQTVRLHSRDYLPPASGQLTEAEQYFLVECWRFPDEPLRFDNQKDVLALAVRVSWPYRLPGSSAPTAETVRSRLTFTVSLNR
jgi:Flp pilus assembly protein TadB